jgi:MFS family permease
MTEPTGPGAATRPASRLIGALGALCLVQFVDVLGVTVVVTALPPMLADVGAAPGDGTLIATGYAMFFGGLLMFGARLGDRFGHRRTILASLVVFAVGALLAATAGSALVLTAARCVQGAAAAGAVPAALRLLTTVADTDRSRARAVAAWSAAGAAAGGAGFVVGGVVTEIGSWRAVFWGLLAVSAGQAAVLLALVPADPRQGGRRPLNLAGSALVTAAVMLVIVATTVVGEPSRRTTGVLLLVGAVLVAGLFVAVDRRSAAPLLPPAVLRRPLVSRGTGAAFLNTATTTSVATLVTLYLQDTLGRTPLQAAATFLPLSVLVIVGSAAASRLMARLARERIAAVGLVVIGIGIALPLVQPTSGVLVGVGMAVTGLGLGLASVVATSMATDVPEGVRATASGIVNTSAQVGAAIGTAAILLLAAGTTGLPGPMTGTPYVAWGAAAVLAGVAAGAFARVRLPGHPADQAGIPG